MSVQIGSKINNSGLTVNNNTVNLASGSVTTIASGESVSVPSLKLPTGSTLVVASGGTLLTETLDASDATFDGSLSTGVNTSNLHLPRDLSARYVKGSDTTAASGYIGEKILASSTTIFSAAGSIGTYYDVTGLAITLGIGNWLLTWNCSIQLNVNAVAGASAYIAGAIREGATTFEAGNKINGTPVNTAMALNGSFTGSKILTISTSKTYKLSIYWGADSGSPTAANFYARNDTYEGYINAIRIA